MKLQTNGGSFPPFLWYPVGTMNNDKLVLLPEPRSRLALPGSYAIQPGRRIVLTGCPARQLLFAGLRLRDAVLKSAGTEWSLAATPSGTPADMGAVLDAGDPRIADPEGYELIVEARGIRISASTVRGVLHGISTLIQILEQCGREIPAMRVTDSPDFPARGVMVDVSRDKVPTLTTLMEMADMFAGWKLNQIQLYTEHTFAYRGHEKVWEKSSPLTGEDIVVYDAYCRERGIELVPNQNSFGHMARWLVHDPYREFADAPDGCQTEWGWFKEPFTLNPLDPRSLALLRDLYDQLLPHFSSRQFNVGCDETVDLGKVRSKSEADRIGVERLYLDFLMAIYREVKARGYTMQFWGDIINKHPELVPELPRDTVAMEWGYEFDHTFDQNCARFASSHIPFYVCPGTSSWNTLTGRTDNAVGNILNSAENGLKHGAIGMLNTDWGDGGHWQYLPVSWLGYACGAAYGWCLGTNRKLDLPRALDLHAFHDKAGVMGKLAYRLGNAYQALGTRHWNATGFNRALASGLDGISHFHGQKPAGWKKCLKAIEEAAAPLAGARMDRPDGSLIKSEYSNAVRMARHGCKRGLLAFERSEARAARTKRALDTDMKGIIAAHRRLWMARNRPGGFAESVGRLESARKAYRG